MAWEVEKEMPAVQKGTLMGCPGFLMNWADSHLARRSSGDVQQEP